MLRTFNHSLKIKENEESCIKIPCYPRYGNGEEVYVRQNVEKDYHLIYQTKTVTSRAFINNAWNPKW